MIKGLIKHLDLIKSELLETINNPSRQQAD